MFYNVKQGQTVQKAAIDREFQEKNSQMDKERARKEIKNWEQRKKKIAFEVRRKLHKAENMCVINTRKFLHSLCFLYNIFPQWPHFYCKSK